MFIRYTLWCFKTQKGKLKGLWGDCHNSDIDQTGRYFYIHFKEHIKETANIYTTSRLRVIMRYLFVMCTSGLSNFMYNQKVFQRVCS